MRGRQSGCPGRTGLIKTETEACSRTLPLPESYRGNFPINIIQIIIYGGKSTNKIGILEKQGDKIGLSEPNLLYVPASEGG